VTATQVHLQPLQTPGADVRQLPADFLDSESGNTIRAEGGSPEERSGKDSAAGRDK
jgi:hypothetical protein